MTWKHKPSGLAAWFGGLLFLAASLSILLFSCVYFGGGALLNRHFNESDVQRLCNDRYIEDLQQYIIKNDLSTKDAGQITRWVEKRKLILLEIYRSNILLYTSSAPGEFLETQNDQEAPYYDWISYYQVSFSDGDAEVVIYTNEAYRWLTFLMIAALVLSFILFLLVFLRGSRGLIRYICQLSTEIQAMEGGDLDIRITIRDDHELTRLAKGLDAMRVAFKEQRERESAIFRANQKMITEMSHDLRTPLTTLQIYTDILRFKKFDPSQLDEYLEKIDAKACQIKQLSENIFEYSLISRHQAIKLNPPVPICQVFHDLLSEFVGHLGSQGFRFELELDWPEVPVAVYPSYIKRLLDNISSNIVKYADPVIPIQVEIHNTQTGVELSFQNAILQRPAEQESNHIGLANMRTMMEKMGGTCKIVQTKAAFLVILTFPPAHPQQESCDGATSGNAAS